MEQYYIDDFGPKYSDLPMEILVKIFGYLNPGDRFAVGLTCKRWLEATQYQHFINDVCLNFYKTHFNDTTNPVLYLLKSFRSFQNVCFTQVDFNETEQFFSRFGLHIHELSFKACDIREKTFICMLMMVPNLRTLRVEGCRELLMSGRLFEPGPDQQILASTLENVTRLSLGFNRFLSDALFKRIVLLMPNLEDLDLTSCSISFHKGLYRKFYPGRPDDASENVLTFYYISQFIERQAHKLKKLNFSSTLIDGDALEVLAGFKLLNLESFDLNSCDQLTNPGITALAQAKTTLQYLDFSKSVRFTDSCLHKICHHLPNLVSLKVRRCRALTDLGIVEIVRLEKLQVLDISECESVTGQGIIKGIASKLNPTLLELYVSALNLCESSVTKIAECFPSLRVLDLSYCFHSVSDLCLQMIFKNLIWLRHLNLDCCDKISDSAMTGVGMLQKVQDFETNKTTVAQSVTPSSSASDEIDQMPPVPSRPSTSNISEEPFKISIRSKAEQEIVNDALRKRAMMEICQQNEFHKDDASTGYSIDRLKGLRVLRLSQCNKLSDISLMYAFKLKELKEISLAKCQQISGVGIKSLVQNCPSLEVVDLSECHNVNDKAIEMIAIHLRRLQILSLERCFQLSDFSLDYIAIHCKALRSLDVRGCRNMCAEPNLRLVNVPTLRTVHMSKPGPYVGEPGYFVKKPPPPPMPKRI
ncbi:F-box and leucine-rich repeat protein 13 [Aedes albopictus]|uniref:F-box domain-containing protein n=1 Tax=Aedes albopictus TaxID=7160 RepID=A0ABM1Y1Q5_AEDAL|nr:dynein regulatory complex subunit 6 isoform X1 [Aedes albopictus]